MDDCYNYTIAYLVCVCVRMVILGPRASSLAQGPSGPTIAIGVGDIGRDDRQNSFLGVNGFRVQEVEMGLGVRMGFWCL